MSEEKKTIDTSNIVSQYKKKNSVTGESSDWKNEQKTSVDMIFGANPVVVERNSKTREDGKVIRVINLIRGTRTMSFDVEAADLVAIAIKQIGGEFVPEELREETIRKESE